VLGLIGAIALLIGLIAIYLHQHDRLGGLGLLGFLVALAGAAMSVGGVWSQVFVVPYLIAEAMATGKMIQTESAFEDPRFQDQESVKLNQIPAVLCAPIGRDIPLGVLYLQERNIEGPFSKEDGERVLFVALQIATMLILVLAANTSFAGFPRLASFQAGDHFLPRQLRRYGDRLVFSNGIFFLAPRAFCGSLPGPGSLTS
jgi:GAF domain-containing protein